MTGAAGEGMMECQSGLHCRSPVMTGQVTASMTGEQIWEVIDGHSEADIALRSRQKQSLQRMTSWRRRNQGRSRGHEPQRLVRRSRRQLVAVT